LGDTYARENARFRDLGREISRLRDAHAMIEAFDALRADIPTAGAAAFEAVREALIARRDRIAAETEADLGARLAELAEAMRAARDDVAAWTLDARDFDAVGPGLRKTYARGRRAMHRACAHPADGRFHEWRKRVKYHWYHVRLLRDLWPRPMRARRRELKVLAERLGGEHDLSVLRATVRGDPDDFSPGPELEAFLRCLARRQSDLRTAAEPLGRRVFAEKPKAFTRRIAAYWHAWR
jgi:CHAD domain-containing protein